MPKGVRLTEILAIMSIVWPCFYLGAFFYYGHSPATDNNTLWLGTALSLINIVALYWFRNLAIFPFAVIFSTINIIHFLPRILGYLVLSKGSREGMFILFPISWSREVINYGLLYVIIGSICSLLGIWLADLLIRKIRTSRNRETPLKRAWFNTPSVFSSICVTLVVYSVSVYFVLFSGLSASSNCFPELKFKWLIHLFSEDTLTLLFLTIFLVMTGIKRKHRIFYLGLIFTYLLYTFALGSRAGILRLALMAIAIISAHYGNAKINVLRSVKYGPLLIIIILLSFPIGSWFRTLKADHCENRADTNYDQNKSAIKFDPKNPTHTLEGGKFIKQGSFNTFYLNKREGADANKLRIPPSITKPLDRLGMLDYPIGILSASNINQNIKKQYFSIKYLFKTVVNNLLPGTPFPGYEVMSARILPMLYRGLSFEHIEANYLSEMYSLWGLSYLLAGYSGGLILIFVSSMALVFFRNAYRCLLPEFVVFIDGIFFWHVLIGCYYLTQGIDYAIVTSVMVSIQGCVLFIMIKMFSIIECKFRNSLQAK